MNAFLETPDDIKWLNETHLKGVTLPSNWTNFESAIMMGPEDSPHAVKLYQMQTPMFDDNYLYVKFVNDGLTYCEYQVYDGKTDKPL